MATTLTPTRAVEVIENVWIPTRDGTPLAARVWRPEDATTQPVPAIVEYIPYRKRDMTRVRDAEMHPYLAARGYACLRVDMRGSGDSHGALTDEYLVQEQEDGLDVLSWLAEQPWCTGRVAMMGKSWGGFNALQIAALRPPELGCVVAVCATDDRYVDDVHYMGGCLLGDNLSWASTMFAYNSCPPDPDIVGDEWRDLWFERLEESGLWLHTWLLHQHRDDYWRHGSICEDWDAVQVPVMAVSGWADGYTNAVFRMLENLKVPRKALVGPWSHKYPHRGVPGPAIGFLEELVRWFDRWLKDLDTGVEDDPRLTVWMQDSVPPTTQYEHRPGRWVAEDTWPTSNVQPRRYRLQPLHLEPAAADEDGEVAPAVPQTVQSPLTLGMFAGKWCSYSATPDLPHDQREEDGGALVFDTEPLDHDLEILGAPIADLELEADQRVAMIAVRLSDVAPDDKATRVTYGLLNLCHRDGHDSPRPLEPGRRYRVRVQLNDIAQVFPQGHRLRVAVSTSYWPLAWPPPRPVRLTVVTGRSSVTLPTRPGGSEPEPFEPFGPPEGAPPLERSLVEATHHTWRVIRDLATDTSTLEVVKDEGVVHMPEIDLELTNRIVERYTSEGDDFTSPRGEVWHERRFRREGWDARTVGHTVLTCDATTFHVHATLDAYEGERRVFSRNWDVTVPRDHV